MERRWLILADDLTGAADSAVAFARRRVPSKVVWGDALPEAHADAVVLAYDLATRELDAPRAALRHADALRRLARPGMRLFKKIDSTLRGHPAEELAAMMDVLLADEPGMRVVFTPAFPAMGRTVLGGEPRVRGVPLPANLVNLIENAGLPAHSVALNGVRAGASVLRAALMKDRTTQRASVAVCDAETDEDLERIAFAVMSNDLPVLFAGSAGLAHALAQQVSRAGAPRSSPDRREPTARGALVVVGSRANASRESLARLSTLDNLRCVSVEPAALRGDAQSAAQDSLARSIAASLADGVDVVVDIAQTGETPGDTRAPLASALAHWLAPAAREASAIMATGGETAAALFARLGVEGIRLVDEIEPGIALGLTLGELSLPAVTKAGGFGDQDCLRRIVSRLRFIRQTGTVA